MLSEADDFSFFQLLRLPDSAFLNPTTQDFLPMRDGDIRLSLGLLDLH
jgi:hypothetical protein